MSLYWPEQKVAVEIIDDPLSQRFDRLAHPDVTVLQVTCAELQDLKACDRFAERLARALGAQLPRRTPEWVAAHERLHRQLFGGNGDCGL